MDWRLYLKYKDIFSLLPMKYEWGTIQVKGDLKSLFLQYLRFYVIYK
jgi:hypothetical protein